LKRRHPDRADSYFTARWQRLLSLSGGAEGDPVAFADVTSRTASSLSDVFAECAALRGLAVSGLTAWTAWETFADFAAVDVAPAPDGDPEALLYQWGTFARAGGMQFHLVLSRLVAVDVGLDAPVLEQLDCRLRYATDPTLTALGRFESMWSADGDTALTSWVAQISGRPEWTVLSPLAPVSRELSTERV
jgi:hypothetical protein